VGILGTGIDYLLHTRRDAPMKYTIHRASKPLGKPEAGLKCSLWARAEELHITHYQRQDSGHRPPTRARALYDDHFLALIFSVEDRYVRAVAENWNDMVCKDSCVEFFVAPSADPDQDSYFNFEVNCGGTMLLYRCPSTAEGATGAERLHLDPADGALIHIASTLPKVIEPEITEATAWHVEYHVPWSLFDKHFGVPAPASGTVWRGNFYKCGDHTSHPHWGSWAPMDSPQPGFHQPAFFQLLHFA
jgi:hypothetical protein